MDRAADRQRDLAVAESVRQGKREAGEFDVFLCYNAEDRAAVKRIGELLKEQEILPWLDEWELPPGRPWIKEPDPLDNLIWGITGRRPSREKFS